MNLAHSSLKIFLAKTVSSVVVFLGLTYFARALGTHQLGVFFLFQALLEMLSIPVDFGIRSAVLKRVSEGKSPDRILSTAVLLKLVPLTLFSGIILAFSGPINTYLGEELAIYLIVALALREFSLLSMHMLKGELRVGETALPTLSSKIVFVGLAITLISAEYGVLSIVYGLIGGSVVMLFWGIYRSSASFGSPSLGYARSLFDYSRYSFISSIGGYFYNWMDIAVIGFFLTQSHVGIYEMAWRVTVVVMIFSQAIAMTVFPQISRWDTEDAIDKIETVIPKAIAPTLFFVIPAFFGALLFSSDILGLLFGPEYSAGWLVLIVLMGEKVFQSVHTILGRSLQGINKPDLAAKAGVIAMFLNLILNVILVVEYGIIGAAVATAVSFFANSVFHAYYLSRFVSIEFPYRQVGGCIFASLGMTVVLRSVQEFLNVDTVPRLLVVVMLGVVIYLGFAYMIPSLRSLMMTNAKRAVS